MIVKKITTQKQNNELLYMKSNRFENISLDHFKPFQTTVNFGLQANKVIAYASVK